MGLSLHELYAVLVAKGGYSISPAYSHLISLESLVTSQLTYRSSATFGCSGNTTVYFASHSLGAVNSVTDDVLSCSCNTVSGNTYAGDKTGCGSVSGASYGCSCYTNCSAAVYCSSDCSCNCDYCSCNCDYCSCDCDYCSCNCDYCDCEGGVACDSECDCNCEY